MAIGKAAKSDAHVVLQGIIRLAEFSKENVFEVAKKLELPPHLARALLFLDKPAPMRELADNLSCDRSYITGIADQLEERGLIERSTGEDRRVKLIKLTSKGKNLRIKLTDGIVDNNPVFTELSQSDRKDLIRILTKAKLD